MTRLERYYPWLISLLVFGGIASLGAAAGGRYAIGVIIGAGCAGMATGELPPCQAALVQLNMAVKTFLAGGGIAVFAGYVASYSYERPPDESSTTEQNA